MNEILHLIGLCPDSAFHWDLVDLLAISGNEMMFSYRLIHYKITSYVFRKN
jgi:hypothetical protein